MSVNLRSAGIEPLLKSGRPPEALGSVAGWSGAANLGCGRREPSRARQNAATWRRITTRTRATCWPASEYSRQAFVSRPLWCTNLLRAGANCCVRLAGHLLVGPAGAAVNMIITIIVRIGSRRSEREMGRPSGGQLAPKLSISRRLDCLFIAPVKLKQPDGDVNMLRLRLRLRLSPSLGRAERAAHLLIGGAAADCWPRPRAKNNAEPDQSSPRAADGLQTKAATC